MAYKSSPEATKDKIYLLDLWDSTGRKPYNLAVNHDRSAQNLIPVFQKVWNIIELKESEQSMRENLSGGAKEAQNLDQLSTANPAFFFTLCPVTEPNNRYGAKMAYACAQSWPRKLGAYICCPRTIHPGPLQLTVTSNQKITAWCPNLLVLSPKE